MLCNTLLGDFCPVHTWSWMMLLHLESSNLHLTLESITTCVSSDNLWASLTFLLHLQKKEKCVPLLSAETKVMQFSILVCQKLMLEEEITTILDSVYSLIHSWQTRSPKVFNTLINCLYYLQTLKGTVYLIWEPMSALLCLHRGHQWAGQSFIMRPQAQFHAHLKNKVTLCGWDQLKIWFRLSDHPLKCLERTQIYTWSEHLFWC